MDIVNPEVIDRYIAELGKASYSKNADRKKTAQLNKNTETVWWGLRDLTDDVELSLYASGIYCNYASPREFDVEFLVFETGKILTATEIGKRKRMADVRGELNDDFGTMFEILKLRIKKTLSANYMGTDGRIKGDKAIGYIGYNRERGGCDVVIDGNQCSWAELEKNISAREGWKIKIEFTGFGDELE